MLLALCRRGGAHLFSRQKGLGHPRGTLFPMPGFPSVYPFATIMVSILPLEHLCSRRAAEASRGLSLQASSSTAATTDGDANNKLFIVNNRDNLEMSC